jgi:hypothetical protein
MAEAVFTGEEIEEFSLQERGRLLAAPLAILAGLTEDFFVRDGPGNAGDRDR